MISHPFLPLPLGVRQLRRVGAKVGCNYSFGTNRWNSFKVYTHGLQIILKKQTRKKKGGGINHGRLSILRCGVFFFSVRRWLYFEKDDKPRPPFEFFITAIRGFWSAERLLGSPMVCPIDQPILLNNLNPMLSSPM